MTENKRYFKRMWEEEYYIFDSETISEEKFDEKVEYEDYRAFEDSMMGDEVVNRLNELHEENQEFRKKTKELIAVSLDYQRINLDLIAEAIKSLRELILND